MGGEHMAFLVEPEGSCFVPIQKGAERWIST